MRSISMNQILDIGIALSKEKNRDRLLELILTTAMDITNCDGGTIYIVNRCQLDFKIMITKSLGILKGGAYQPINLPPVPLDERSVCAFAAVRRVMVNVPDGYGSDMYSFTGPKSYDAITGYKTVSMLVVPMEDDKGHVIGVLQLLNAMDDTGAAIPFERSYEQVIRSLSSQAAISLTNMNYEAAVQGMMDSFVRVMATAIDARTPYNANHTRGMTRIATRFLQWLRQREHPWSFNEEKEHLFLMSVWLHDIGKLTIPLEIMDKESRLGSHIEAVLYRFQVISLLSRMALLKEEITQKEYAEVKRALEAADELVCQTNKEYILTEEMIEQIQELGKRVYLDDSGSYQTWLSEEETATLSVPRGTLTPSERTIMESHVVMTSRMLDEMKFPREYQCVPDWAEKHHEFLNGSGYPEGLSGDAIPKEARLLTILDIFDALTQERPYSPPQPVRESLAILDSMVEEGKLDGEILQLFKQSRAWEETE